MIDFMTIRYNKISSYYDLVLKRVKYIFLNLSKMFIRIKRILHLIGDSVIKARVYLNNCFKI